MVSLSWRGKLFLGPSWVLITAVPPGIFPKRLVLLELLYPAFFRTNVLKTVSEISCSNKSIKEAWLNRTGSWFYLLYSPGIFPKRLILLELLYPRFFGQICWKYCRRFFCSDKSIKKAWLNRRGKLCVCILHRRAGVVEIAHEKDKNKGTASVREAKYPAECRTAGTTYTGFPAVVEVVVTHLGQVIGSYSMM